MVKDSSDVAVEDVRAMAEALGLGGHARPYSAHEVVRREILPALSCLAGPACEESIPPSPDANQMRVTFDVAPQGLIARRTPHVSDDLEVRVRKLVERIEAVDTYRPDDIGPDHWFNCGMDEAYDNVLDWLYRDVLGEER